MRAVVVGFGPCGLFAALLNVWVDAWTPICHWFGEKICNVGMGQKLGEWAFPVGDWGVAVGD